MNADWCAVYVAFGAAWRRQAAESIASFKRFHPDISVTVVSTEPVDGASSLWDLRTETRTPIQQSREAKTQLSGGQETPYLLYLDADTEVCGDLTPYIDPLRNGFDMTITLSINQGVQILRHISDPERRTTLGEVGIGAVQLQGGAFAFAQNERTAAFFEAWREEWLRWKGADQGALMRAIQRVPLRLWLLGRDFNGGKVLRHRSAGGQ